MIFDGDAVYDISGKESLLDLPIDNVQARKFLTHGRHSTPMTDIV